MKCGVKVMHRGETYGVLWRQVLHMALSESPKSHTGNNRKRKQSTILMTKRNRLLKQKTNKKGWMKLNEWCDEFMLFNVIFLKYIPTDIYSLENVANIYPEVSEAHLELSPPLRLLHLSSYIFNHFPHSRVFDGLLLFTGDLVRVDLFL